MKIFVVLCDDIFHYAFSTNEAAEEYLARRYGESEPCDIHIAEETVHKSGLSAIKESKKE